MAERISRTPRSARRTDMKNDDLTPEIAALAAELAAPAAGADDASWERLRDRVAARALATGLADVAVERHDSPLGRIVLGATEAGLVRVGLPRGN